MPGHKTNDTAPLALCCKDSYSSATHTTAYSKHAPFGASESSQESSLTSTIFWAFPAHSDGQASDGVKLAKKPVGFTVSLENVAEQFRAWPCSIFYRKAVGFP